MPKTVTFKMVSQLAHPIFHEDTKDFYTGAVNISQDQMSRVDVPGGTKVRTFSLNFYNEMFPLSKIFVIPFLCTKSTRF